MHVVETRSENSFLVEPRRPLVGRHVRGNAVAHASALYDELIARIPNKGGWRFAHATNIYKQSTRANHGMRSWQGQ